MEVPIAKSLTGWSYQLGTSILCPGRCERFKAFPVLSQSLNSYTIIACASGNKGIVRLLNAITRNKAHWPLQNRCGDILIIFQCNCENIIVSYASPFI